MPVVRTCRYCKTPGIPVERRADGKLWPVEHSFGKKGVSANAQLCPSAPHDGRSGRRRKQRRIRGEIPPPRE